MVAPNEILVADISGQKKMSLNIPGDLSHRHTIGQTIDHYLDRSRIRRNGKPFSAFSRGQLLDNKRLLPKSH